MPGKKAKIKIILDTNIWISYLITNSFKELDDLIRLEKVELIFSIELIEEFIEVIQRPKLKKYFKENAVNELFSQLMDIGIIITIKSRVDGCRDKKDNFLLALAKDSKAHFLISGDKDLLEIGKFGKTRIIKYQEFIKIVSK